MQCLQLFVSFYLILSLFTASCYFQSSVQIWEYHHWPVFWPHPQGLLWSLLWWQQHYQSYQVIQQTTALRAFFIIYILLCFHSHSNFHSYSQSHFYFHSDLCFHSHSHFPFHFCFHSIIPFQCLHSTSVAYVSPSVTSYQQLNMGFRIYTMDGNYSGSTYVS